jgi:uncharacterized protein YggE
MRKIIIAIAILFIGNNVKALDIKDKIITVSSSSEMFIQPDEIELEITLKEQSGTSYISKIEEAFWKKLGEHEIGKRHLVLENVNVMYYWYYWWKTRDADKKSRKIVLKLDNKTNFLKLVKALNHDWVTDIKIIGVSNKNTDQHIKDIKVKAMKAAKDKATYLLESIGEKVGGVIAVEEVNSNNSSNNNLHIDAGNKYSSESFRKSGGGSFERIPEIRLSYSIKSKFQII